MAGSPAALTRGEGANNAVSGVPNTASQRASTRGLMAAPPLRACMAMAASCGLAASAATAAVRAAWRSLASVGPRASQGSMTAAASIPAMIADSWLTRTDPPRTSPTAAARRQLGRRTRRTAASSVSGRNSAPAARLR
jgi:hypothetical protein